MPTVTVPSINTPNMAAPFANQRLPVVPNPMDMANQALGLQHNMLVNRQILAQQAAGKDLQQAINPLTGQLNEAKYRQLISNTPAAALAAQDAYGHSLAFNQQQIQNAWARMKHVGDIAGELLAKNGQATPQAVRKAIDLGIKENLISPTLAARLSQSVGNTNESATAFTRQVFAQAQQGIANLQPHLGAADVGPNIDLYNTNSASGDKVGQQVAALHKGLSPSDANRTERVETKNGRIVTVTEGSIQHQGLAGAVENPATSVATTPSPEMAQMHDQVTQAVQMNQQLSEAANTAATNWNNLQQIKADVNNLPMSGGKISSLFGELATNLNGLGLTNAGTNYNLLAKGASAAALNGVWGAGGAPKSDFSLSTSLDALPSADKTRVANETVIGLAQGQLEYGLVKQATFNHYYKNTPATDLNTGDFTANFARNAPPPFAYSFPTLPEQVKQEYLKSLKPSQQLAFMAQVNQAQELLKAAAPNLGGQ